jgi:hypothetical protein
MTNQEIATRLAYTRYRVRTFGIQEPRSKILLRAIVGEGLPLLNPFKWSSSPRPCDILFLFPNETGFHRAHTLYTALEQRGFKMRHEFFSSWQPWLLGRLFYDSEQKLPAELLFPASLARYFVYRYRPKVVCSFVTTLTSSFLREEVHRLNGGKTIFLSHGIPTAVNFNSNFDFDYVFVFGQSSLENVLASPVRLGTTRIVLTGSPFVESTFSLPPNYEKKQILFFSTWFTWASSVNTIGKKLCKEILRQNTDLVLEWARRHPEFPLLIKPHPLEDPRFIRELTRDIPHVTVLETSMSMREALQQVSLVLLFWSNASVEAALLQRPTVVVNVSDLAEVQNVVPANYLSLEDYFLPRAKTVEEIQHNIVTTFANYEEYLQRCQQFASYHLEHTTDSIEYIAHCIEAIYHEKEDFPVTPVQEDVSKLDIEPHLKRLTNE